MQIAPPRCTRALERRFGGSDRAWIWFLEKLAQSDRYRKWRLRIDVGNGSGDLVRDPFARSTTAGQALTAADFRRQLLRARRLRVKPTTKTQIVRSSRQIRWLDRV